MEAIGWSEPIEVHPIDVDRLDIPSRTSGNDEIVGGLIVKSIVSRLEVLRWGGVGPRIVVLVVENYLRKFRHWQNPERMSGGGATASLGKLRNPLACNVCVSLRQREWDHAYGDKRKQQERASKNMSLNGCVNLFFHFFNPP
jgi:hypothetical protein